MFAEKIKNGVVDPDKPAIDRKLRMDSSMNDTPYKEVEEAACALGHVINVCKYMEHATVRRVMNNTLQDLDDVL